jgi:hypothetical protein
VDPAGVPVSSNVADQIQTSDIYVDAEGDWFNEGTRIFRQEIIEIFLRNLHLNPDGTWFIEWQQNRCLLPNPWRGIACTLFETGLLSICGVDRGRFQDGGVFRRARQQKILHSGE